LTVPYEYILHLECLNYGTLMFAGGWLDQPHILIRCFRIIADEDARWQEDRRVIEQRNKELVEQANAQTPKKRSK
jgi:hypothetical protein